MTPAYYSYQDDGVYRYYSNIIEKVPEVSIILYNYLKLCGYKFSVQVIERLVKTIKNPLSKCLMDKLLTDTEYYTVLTDVEASVNVRPLSTTSENPDEKNSTTYAVSHYARLNFRHHT